MSPRQFWEDDPWLAAAYRMANDIKRQRKSEEMWLQGLYNFHSVSTALSNLNFDKKKRKKPNKYMEEPIRVVPLTEAEKEIKAQKEREKVIAFFNDMERRWKRKQK